MAATFIYSQVSGSPFTLGVGWTYVTTIAVDARALRIAPMSTASSFDIEWVTVPAGSPPPTDTFGEAVLGGEDFAGGIPIGDLYLRSAGGGQLAIVKKGL